MGLVNLADLVPLFTWQYAVHQLQELIDVVSLNDGLKVSTAELKEGQTPCLQMRPSDVDTPQHTL